MYDCPVRMETITFKVDLLWFPFLPKPLSAVVTFLKRLIVTKNFGAFVASKCK